MEKNKLSLLLILGIFLVPLVSADIITPPSIALAMVALPLLFTIIIEFAVLAIAIKQKILKVLLYTVLINAVTNPLINLAVYGFGSYNPLYIIVGEFIVFIVEFLLIKLLFKIKWWKAIVISLVANIASFFIGGWILMGIL